MNSKINKGIFLAGGTAIISGVSNYLNKFALAQVGDPLLLTTLKNATVAAAVIALLLLTHKLPELKKLSKKDIIGLLAIGIIGGSLPFYLFFLGLSQMPAVNAALIHKTLIFWVAALALPVLGERITLKQTAALGLIFSANLLIGSDLGLSFTKPGLLVLAATILWAVENVIAKIVLKRIEVGIVVAARMGIGAIVLLAALVISGKGAGLFTLNPQQLSWIILTSILLFGYVLTWYRALALAPVTLVATILSLATLVTNGLASGASGKFAFAEFAQAVFVISGCLVFLNFRGKKDYQTKEKALINNR